MRRRGLIAALAALSLAACAQGWDATMPSSPPGGTGIAGNGSVTEGPEAYASVTRVSTHDEAGAVAPYGSQGTAAAYEYETGYKVGAGDRLTVRVAGEAELSSEYVVDGSGNISMPYIQTVQIAGMTAPEIENHLSAKLRNGYLRNPTVSVQVTTLRPFYIMGEVQTGGSFSYQPGVTVQNAIAIAGGYGPRADQGDVMITRKNAEGTHTYKVPVTTQVYPGDIIYVRERWF